MWHNDVKHIMITCNKYIYMFLMLYILQLMYMLQLIYVNNKYIFFLYFIYYKLMYVTINC